MQTKSGLSRKEAVHSLFKRNQRRGWAWQPEVKCGNSSRFRQSPHSPELTVGSAVRHAKKLYFCQPDGFLGVGEVQFRVFAQQFQTTLTVHLRGDQIDIGAGAGRDRIS